jgi:hypothetical protein
MIERKFVYSVHYAMAWEELQDSHQSEEVLQLLKPGDDVTIHEEEYTIITTASDGKTICCRPHEGYLGDRNFPIDLVVQGVSEELLVERRLELLKLEEENNE